MTHAGITRAGLTRAGLRARLLLVTLGTCLLLAGCGVPRGAGLVSEVTAGAGDAGDAGDAAADFAVYPVTRAFLAEFASWPATETRPHWLSHAHGPAQRVIRPGDTIELAIWDAAENSLLTAQGSRVTPLSNLRVSPTGMIFVPYVGDVKVGGMTPEAARLDVERALEMVVSSAQVQLAMVEGTGNTVNLVGGVASPGRYAMPDMSYSVLDLIAEGGGVPATLRNPQVMLHRGHQSFGTSLAALYDAPRRDTVLRSGDSVIVEEDGRTFLSLGASGQETVHGFTKDVLTATEAVAIAGGVNEARGDIGAILVLRDYPASAVGTGGPAKDRVIFALDLTTADGLFSAKTFEVASGDIIYASEAPLSRTSSIIGVLGSALGLAGRTADLGN